MITPSIFATQVWLSRRPWGLGGGGPAGALLLLAAAAVRALPESLSDLRVFPSKSVFVWRLCMDAQGASQPKTALFRPGQ